MNSAAQRLLIAALVAGLLAGFFALDLGQYASLAALRENVDRLAAYRDQQPLLVSTLYFLVYVGCVALSLPVAAVLTLAGGALFGLLWGTLLVSFASTLGATLAFLVARFLLREWVQTRYGARLAGLNRGVERDGVFYLFVLRMIPHVPFFLINLGMALTPIRTLPFYLTSQAGMLAGTVAYVFAGTQLATVERPADILSPGLIGALIVIGLLPLAARKVVDRLRARRAFRGHSRPARFDANLTIIGGGSAGLVAAIVASTARAKVVLVEQDRMGGDCLNRGCVPSKSLLRSATIASYVRRAAEFGIRTGPVEVDFREVMERVRRIIRTIEPHDSMERYRGLGVECIEGRAEIVDPWRVRVGPREIRTRAIVIATGATPLVPSIEGIGAVDYLTSDNIWNLDALPARLLVVGGGPIGCELAQAFARLGSKVTVVDLESHLLPREDPDVAELLQGTFEREGIELWLGWRAERFEVDGTGSRLVVQRGQERAELAFDRVLIAVGRRANAAALGSLPFAVRPDGTLEVNEYLQTSVPNIYACGDVTGPYQFTHMASHQAWYATINALFGFLWRFRVDASVVPWATYTDPEVGHVGLNERSAREAGVPYEVTRIDVAGVDRFVTDSEGAGFVKVLTVPGSDRILGATIAAHGAGDLIGEYVSAMTHGIGLGKLMRRIHIYPTHGEITRAAATAWRRERAPERLLQFARRLFAWQRGSSPRADIEPGTD